MQHTSSHAFLVDHILKQSLDLICTIDRDGRFLYVNEASTRLLGYEPREMSYHLVRDFVHPADQERTDETRAEIIEGEETNMFVNRLISKCGKEVTFSWSGVWSEEECALVCIGRDITEQVQAKNKATEKEDLYQALIEHGSDLLALLDEKGTFKYVSKSHDRLLGYEQSQLIGQNALSLIHPEELPKALAALDKVTSEGQNVTLDAFRYKNAANEWRWLETIASNQLHNPSIKALVLASRDITEPILNKLKIKENEQRFKALFENNPDMVFFETKEGVIQDVNPAVLSYYEVGRSTIVGKKLSDFLSPEAAQVCKEKKQEALAGNRVQFELEMTLAGHESKGKVYLDLSKMPVEINGEIVGLYTISRDITAIRTSQNTIRQQAKKLNNIFESITDAFFTIDRDWNFTYLNKECERLLAIDRLESVGKNILDVFPEERNGEFHKQYKYSVTTGHSVNFEAYLERNDKWLEVRAFPYVDGLSVYFADITARVQAKRELAKLSIVASRTTNGVLIMDPNFIIEWVNEGFTKITGYSFEESVGRRPIELLGHQQTNFNEIKVIREKMSNGEPVAFEILNSSRNGQDIWLSVEENPIFGENGEITGFVSTQTDITALKKSELELTQLTKDLYRHNRDMQQFTYIVSHNLRSPVANVIGLTNLLNKVDKNSDAFDKSLANLRKSVTQLDLMLKDMNTILSVKDVKETFSKEDVELNEVLQQVLSPLQEPLEQCGGKITLRIPENHFVSGNRAYLHSIFYNLLSNAIKYKSTERPLEVVVGCHSNADGETVLSVTDNGSGFDMNKVGSKLFKIYNRFHAGAAEGRGIGLFLVKTHVEALGGTIDVESKVNKGTTFTIKIK